MYPDEVVQSFYFKIIFVLFCVTQETLNPLLSVLGRSFITSQIQQPQVLSCKFIATIYCFYCYAQGLKWDLAGEET